MKILLDTHILIWALTNSPKLPKRAEELICAEDNEIYYSIISLWEIEIKHINHPTNMTVSSKTILKVAKNSGYQLLNLNSDSIAELPNLKRPDTAPRHKDPYDRMLICQAITENMLFVTHDSLLSDYHVANVIYVP